MKLKEIKACAKTTNGVGTDASGRPRLNANDIRRATLVRAAHVNSGHRGKMTAPDQGAVTTEPVQRPGHTIGVDILDLPSPSIGGNTKMLAARC